MAEPPSEIRNTAATGPGVLSLGALAAAACSLEGIRRAEVAPGDRLVVATRNSIYSLVAREDGTFVVSGGRYAREGLGEPTLVVHGCTVGGRALFTGIVAGPGLFLEFGDGTVTTRIRSVRRFAASPTRPD
jgi:hypothetical protein